MQESFLKTKTKTAAAAVEGTLFTWGYGAHGQLGHGDGGGNRQCPSLVTRLFSLRATAVACGGSSTVVLSSAGTVHSTGGAAGHTPRAVVGLRGFHAFAIAAGAEHNLALDRSCTRVLLWGDVAGRMTPPRCVHDGPRVACVAAGAAFSLLLLAEGGAVLAFGVNSRGQLGLGDTVDRARPQQMPGVAHVRAIAAGSQHALMLTDSLELLVCGCNKYGQLGLGDLADRTVATPVRALPAGASFVRIGGGDCHSLAATAVCPPVMHNRVFGWGRRVHCGVDASEHVLVPTTVDSANARLQELGDSAETLCAGGAFNQAHNAILTRGGRLLMFGTNEHGQCAVVGASEVRAATPVEAFEHKTVVAVSCGWLHSAAIVANIAPPPKKDPSQPAAVAAAASEPQSPFGMFEALGNDAILHLVSFLTEPRDVLALAATSHAFRDLTSSNLLWQHLFVVNRIQWTPKDERWETAELATPSGPVAELARAWAAAGGVQSGMPNWRLRFVHCHRGGSRYLFGIKRQAQKPASKSVVQRLKRILGGRENHRLLMLGLDAAGKTTILYKLKLGEVVITIPTIGFNVETVTYSHTDFTVWDVGGEDKIRPLWRHYYQNTSGIIYVVDSNDRERMDEYARGEVEQFSNESELLGIPFLVLCNKQDLPNALHPAEIRSILDLDHLLRDRPFQVLPCCSLTGEGLYEGLDWLVSTLERM